MVLETIEIFYSSSELVGTYTNRSYNVNITTIVLHLVLHHFCYSNLLYNVLNPYRVIYYLWQTYYSLRKDH